MKLALVLLSFSIAFSASAKSLSCKATLSSTKLDNAKYFEAIDWMAANKVKDESLIPKELLPSPVKVDTRTTELDEDGDADLAGIIIDSYEKHGISLNYAVYARNGSITDVSVENEVIRGGSGIHNIKGQTEVEFGVSSETDGASLELICTIK